MTPCAGKQHLFFARTAEFPAVRAARETRAKALCAKCDVIDKCRELGRHEPWGIWGGRTAAERGYAGIQSRRGQIAS